MRLSMSNIAWAPEERLEAYAAMAEHGVRGLEIAPGLFFHAAADPFAPDAATAERALEEIAAQGLSLVSMQSLLFGVSGAALFEGDDARGRLETGMVRAIDLAGRFGIPNLVFGSPGQRRIPEGMDRAEAQDLAAAFFARLGDRAQAAGARIAMEANPEVYGTNFLNTLEEAADFVAEVDHPAVAPILDLGAMHINGAYADTPGWVARLGPALSHVHVSEPGLAPAPASAEALVPVLDALRAAGYGRAVSIEMKRAPEGIAAVRAALSHFEQAGKAGKAGT